MIHPPRIEEEWVGTCSHITDISAAARLCSLCRYVGDVPSDSCSEMLLPFLPTSSFVLGSELAEKCLCDAILGAVPCAVPFGAWCLVPGA